MLSPTETEEVHKMLYDLIDERSPLFNTTLWSTQWDHAYRVSHGDNIEIHIDMPGVDPKDVTIEPTDDGNFLHITGFRVLPTDEKKSIVRQARIPVGTDQEGIHGTFKNGVLILTFPKKAKAKIKVAIEDQSNENA